MERDSTVRSALAAVHFDPGYEVSHQAMASVNLPMNKLDEANGRRVLKRMLEAARHVPGVQRASLASALPAVGASPVATFLPDGDLPNAASGALSRYAIVSPGFFDSLGIRLERGRDFSDVDGPTTD